jgi:outer membrane lipoprotein-sorting protein
MSYFNAGRAALIGMALAVAPLQAFALAPADQTMVDQAVSYLQSMKSVKGRFVQTDARGSTSQGSISVSYTQIRAH